MMVIARWNVPQLMAAKMVNTMDDSFVAISKRFTKLNTFSSKWRHLTENTGVRNNFLGPSFYKSRYSDTLVP